MNGNVSKSLSTLERINTTVISKKFVKIFVEVTCRTEGYSLGEKMKVHSRKNVFVPKSIGYHFFQPDKISQKVWLVI